MDILERTLTTQCTLFLILGVNSMRYIDLNGVECQLSFKPEEFGIPSRHVLVIAKYQEQWVLTKHKERGLEFPGGKQEPGESLMEAAVREVYEETGAVVSALAWFAEYVVAAEPPFCKTVFLGEIERLERIEQMETDGLVLAERLELGETFSFLMKDEGMKEIIKKVEQLGKWND